MIVPEAKLCLPTAVLFVALFVGMQSSFSLLICNAKSLRRSRRALWGLHPDSEGVWGKLGR